ncbi:hypothetical protein ACFL60_01005 [Candidatus Omnitrophota bacterium]
MPDTPENNDHTAENTKKNIKDSRHFSRRQFVRFSTATMGGLLMNGASSDNLSNPNSSFASETKKLNESEISVIGPYGHWAASLTEGQLPTFSYRRGSWPDLEQWREAAHQRLTERLGIPDIGGIPDVRITKQYFYDDLHVEELTWELPYGPPTEAILLKPRNTRGKLPGILAFHDHGGIKYFGKRKITRTADKRHSMIEAHQKEYYSGRAWANELAKRGYVVLVSDAFPFGSRRVLLQDVPEIMRNGLNDENPENPDNITAYNTWAGEHESVMAKSLFCAGTTWPGVFFAEDRIALDILCSRDDVDKKHIGCGGLSGGGMRTVFTGGLDPRITCAVCVGFMTTWRDFLLNKSFTHTWMTYVPITPKELDFPEIFGLRVPLPALVQNDSDDFLYTLPEMKRADTILRDVYRKAGAEDRYRCSFYPGEHKFDSEMQTEAFDWFDRWLKT